MFDFDAPVSKFSYLVVALGRGYQVDEAGQPIGICAAGRERADMARDIADDLKYHGYTVALCASAGRERSRRYGLTMAELTGEYWQRHQCSVPLLINRDDPEIWGTLGELEWVQAYLQREKKLATTIVVVVAAPRQDIRVKRMQTWFKFLPELQLEVVFSSEKPIPLYHELLGYGKLTFIYCGLRPLAEWFRQVTAHPIKQSSKD